MNRLIVIILLVISCSAMPRLAAADMIDIDNQKLKELMEQGVPVIDVRRADEWSNTGVIEGSHLITFFDKAGKYDAEKWKTALSSKIDAKEPVILICHSGVRTSIIGKWLSEQVETVYNVDEGIVSWLKDGNGTVQPKEP